MPCSIGFSLSHSSTTDILSTSLLGPICVFVAVVLRVSSSLLLGIIVLCLLDTLLALSSGCMLLSLSILHNSQYGAPGQFPFSMSS